MEEHRRRHREAYQERCAEEEQRKQREDERASLLLVEQLAADDAAAAAAAAAAASASSSVFAGAWSASAAPAIGRTVGVSAAASGGGSASVDSSGYDLSSESPEDAASLAEARRLQQEFDSAADGVRAPDGSYQEQLIEDSGAAGPHASYFDPYRGPPAYDEELGTSATWRPTATGTSGIGVAHDAVGGLTAARGAAAGVTASVAAAATTSSPENPIEIGDDEGDSIASTSSAPSSPSVFGSFSSFTSFLPASFSFGASEPGPAAATSAALNVSSASFSSFVSSPPATAAAAPQFSDEEFARRLQNEEYSVAATMTINSDDEAMPQPLDVSSACSASSASSATSLFSPEAQPGAPTAALSSQDPAPPLGPNQEPLSRSPATPEEGPQTSFRPADTEEELNMQAAIAQSLLDM
eukprot:GHVT01076526.1.p1 GENE.GHVT01076526.1~~GHVT01076526.1.p1  ORF type:complete len:412 (+),score=135.10 GHVT01076526.1:425-1660(+)